MSEVERVTKAIIDSDLSDSGISLHDAEMYARAAIAAVRDADDNRMGGHQMLLERYAEDAWQAMADAALK